MRSFAKAPVITNVIKDGIVMNVLFKKNSSFLCFRESLDSVSFKQSL